MAESIHTIPVLNAIRKAEGCAFCAMKAQLEADSIRFILGPAYMEDDVRMETNKIGFCKHHLKALYEEQNRLGLALMLHTHMQEINKKINKASKNKIPRNFFSKSKDSAVASINSVITSVNDSCYVCNKIEKTFKLYFETFITLWKQSIDKELFKSLNGFCLSHFSTLLSFVEKNGRSTTEKFTSEFFPRQIEYMNTLEADLDWFIQKFDFRNKDEPWKNSKDVLPRAIALLGEGTIV